MFLWTLVCDFVLVDVNCCAPADAQQQSKSAALRSRFFIIALLFCLFEMFMVKNGYTLCKITEIL